MSRLVLNRVENPCLKIDPLATTIRHTVEAMIEFYNGKLSKHKLNYLLCTAAVCHLGSRRTAQLMASESYKPTRTADGPINLLTLTALLGSLEILDILLSKGAQLKCVSKYFGTPLQAAAGQGHYEMVLHLLKHAADVNYVGGDDVLWKREAFMEKGTALRSAARRNHGSIVRLLLDPTHNLKTSGADYEYAIMDAVYAGHTEIVKLLLESCTFPDRLNLRYRILWAACRFGHIQLVQTMLDKGLEVNSLALEYAVCYGHGSIVSLLLDNSGADRDYSAIRFHAIRAAASNGHQESLQMLLHKGVDVNSPGSGYEDPLFKASKNQQLDTMRLLLNNGADLYANECGDLAFYHAVEQGHEEVVFILAQAGIDVDGYPCLPPIVLAMKHGQEKIVKLLLELGAGWLDDPVKSICADDFLDGIYPLLPPPEPLSKA